MNTNQHEEMKMTAGNGRTKKKTLAKIDVEKDDEKDAEKAVLARKRKAAKARAARNA